MNIALGALIITILLLPGAVVLRAYYTSFRDKEKDLHVPFSELLFRGLIISFLAHFIALSLLKFLGINADFQLLYRITTGDKFTLNNESFSQSFIQFGAYNIFLVSLLILLTKAFKRIVLHNNLDLRYYGLQSSNFWFMIFSARYLDSSSRRSRERTDLIWIDILARGDIVYSGFLYDFEYSAGKDELLTITLKNALKRTYRKSEEEAQKPVEADVRPHPLKLDKPRAIQGDAFLIMAKDIVNINLTYISLSGV